MDILNQIATIATPIIVGGVVGLIIKLIKPIGDVAIKYFTEKTEASGITKQLAQHQDELLTAKQVWGIIEEKYRLTEKVEDLLVSKADMFDQLLLAKIPYLTQENLSDLRQALAGEFNKGKKAVITDETLKQSQVDLTNINASLTDTNNQLQATNDKLESDKAVLQARLDQITNALNPVVTPIVDNTNTVTNESAQSVVDNATNETINTANQTPTV